MILEKHEATNMKKIIARQKKIKWQCGSFFVCLIFHFDKEKL